MSQLAGLIHAVQLDGNGGAIKLNEQQVIEQITAPKPTVGVIPVPANGTSAMWLHFDLNQLDTLQLQSLFGLTLSTIEMLCAIDTRPRCVDTHNGVMLNLRGINVNPGEEPDDMVSLRILCQPHLFISIRRRKIYSVAETFSSLEEGKGPHALDELLASLAKRLTHRMSNVIGELEDKIDVAEDRLFAESDLSVSDQLYELRTQLIHYRRYFAPQKDAVLALINLKPMWLHAQAQFELQEKVESLQRLIEQIDTLKERLAAMKGEIDGQLAKSSEQRIYILTIVAGMFVPLSFITGLLGINVGGIPLADSEWGFAIVSGLIVVSALIQIAIFYLRKWF
jgi:zinc transporter